MCYLNWHVGSWRVRSNRFEDRIRELCTQAVASGDDDFPEVMAQLRSAMRQPIERVRGMAVEQLQGGKERRFRENE